jgi:hypothetical protein
LAALGDDQLARSSVMGWEYLVVTATGAETASHRRIRPYHGWRLVKRLSRNGFDEHDTVAGTATSGTLAAVCWRHVVGSVFVDLLLRRLPLVNKGNTRLIEPGDSCA